MKPVWCDAQANLVKHLKGTMFSQFLQGEAQLVAA
jgi:hypothetical protein